LGKWPTRTATGAGFPPQPNVNATKPKVRSKAILGFKGIARNLLIKLIKTKKELHAILADVAISLASCRSSCSSLIGSTFQLNSRPMGECIEGQHTPGTRERFWDSQSRPTTDSEQHTKIA